MFKTLFLGGYEGGGLVLGLYHRTQIILSHLFLGQVVNTMSLFKNYFGKAGEFSIQEYVILFRRYEHGYQNRIKFQRIQYLSLVFVGKHTYKYIYSKKIPMHIHNKLFKCSVWWSACLPCTRIYCSPKHCITEGGSVLHYKVQNHPQTLSEFKANLRHMRPCSKT